MVEHQTLNTRSWCYLQTPGTHGHPGGGGVVFSKDLRLGQLELGLVECHESGEGASINADRHSEKLGLNVDRRPQAGGLH